MARSPGMISTRSVPRCRKVDKPRRADADNEIPGDRRRRAVGYVVIELFEFGFCLGMEDDPVLRCLPGFRLLRAVTRLEPRKNRFRRNALSRILLELAQARRDFLA